MRKMMSVIFFGLEHFERNDHINFVRRLVGRWNEKSGKEIHPDTAPHEELTGVFLLGGAIVKNTDPTKENFWKSGVIFQTTYQDYSWAPNCRPTCFAFEDWLKTEKVLAALVLHQEESKSEGESTDER